MSSKLLKAVILGAPGSGKGTIANRIVRDFGFQHRSSGDLLRSHILNKTAAGLEAQCYIQEGKLVPDQLMVNLIVAELTANTNESHLLLDGFPRTKGQAEALQSKHPVNLVINLDVPSEVIVERIRGRWTHLASGRIYHVEFNPPKKHGIDDITGESLVQREDDKPEVLNQRLKTYTETINPVLDYYRKLLILHEFQGRESNEIWPRVHKFLSTIIPPKSGPF